MRHLRFLLPVIAAAAIAACKLGDPHAGLPAVTVDDLAGLLASNAATVIDANNASTREEYGVIPGALLLSNYGDYAVESELPSDKDAKLVFYCSSERCAAAPKAALKAVDAGYTDVAVLPEGIKGWKSAGKETAPAT